MFSKMKKTLKRSPQEDHDYDPLEIIPMMNGIYDLMAKMRYIKHEQIIQPPHKPLNAALVKSLNIDPVVVDILQKLPYISGRGSEDNFYGWGGFTQDLTGDAALKRSRDPFYASPDYKKRYDEEGGPYIRPWVMALNEVGNRGDVLFFDTRTGQLWAVSQSGGSADVGLLETIGLQEHIEEPENTFSFEHLPSRPAAKFFRDFTIRLHTLEWIPFRDVIYHLGWPEHDDLEVLFRAFGWPDNFDGPGFDVGAKCYREFSIVQKKAKEAISELNSMLEESANAVQSLKDAKERLEQGLKDQVGEEELTSLREGLAAAEENSRWVAEELATLKDVSRDLEGLDEDGMIEKGWEMHIRGDMKWLQANIDFYIKKELEGTPVAGNKLEESREQMKRLEDALKQVKTFPKTLKDAVKPGRRLVALDIHG